jgi:predicted N-acetyltransferase YhbS
MRITRYHDISLDKIAAARIVALLEEVFGGGFGGQGHLLHRHHMRLVIREANRVVAHLALGLRVMRLGEALIDVVTVAEVATHPDRRGEGLASALLADAITAAEGTGAPFMALFGDAGLYAGAGFRPVTNPVRRVGMKGRVTGAVIDGPIDDLMVRALGEAAWDEALPLDLLGAKF